MISLPCKHLYEQFGRGEFTSTDAGLGKDIEQYKKKQYIYRSDRRPRDDNRQLQAVWRLTERGIRRAKKEMKEDEK